MDVVFSVCIVKRGAIGARAWKCECFVMQMVYFCVLCASCGSYQCCVLHDLQLVNAGRGCKRRPYGRTILQSRSHNWFVGNHECILMFTPSCFSECFYDLLRFVCVYLDVVDECAVSEFWVFWFTMSSGRSLQFICIFPFGMLCLSAISMMFVKILLVVCILMGMVVWAKTDSVFRELCPVSFFLVGKYPSVLW